MSPLQPFEDLIHESVGDAISATQKENKLPGEKLKEALNNGRGSIENVAYQLIDLMQSAENENVRLSAAKMIATAHGALAEMNDNPPPVININIAPLNDGKQAIINILMPKGRKEDAERTVEAIN